MTQRETFERLDPASLFSVAGKVALVTGGSRGIGLMIAQGYVEAGAKVYIASRAAEACKAVAEALSKWGSCQALAADLSSLAGCRSLAKAIAAREDRLDILVNNAGATWGAPMADYPEDGFDKVLDLNLKATFFLTRELRSLLEKASQTTHPARVINIGSIDGLRVPGMETYAYSASKAAIHHLTRVLAVELGRSGITVNAVAPGPFPSKMMKATLERHQAAIESSCPLGRIGVPADMAGIAIFLASRAADYINGAVIPVDGGIHIR